MRAFSFVIDHRVFALLLIFVPASARARAKVTELDQEALDPDSRTTTIAGHLLCAVPQLQDPNFRRSVVLMLEHGEHGALGLVLNNVTEARLLDVSEALDLKWCGDPTDNVRLGGPVDPEVGWLLHDDDAWDPSARALGGGLFLTTSLEPVIQEGNASFGGRGRQHMFLLGYAGWGCQQLEAEIASGSWVLVPIQGLTRSDGGVGSGLGVAPEWLFSVSPDDMWEGALRSIRVDPQRLVGLQGGLMH